MTTKQGKQGCGVGRNTCIPHMTYICICVHRVFWHNYICTLILPAPNLFRIVLPRFAVAAAHHPPRESLSELQGVASRQSWLQTFVPWGKTTTPNQRPRQHQQEGLQCLRLLLTFFHVWGQHVTVLTWQLGGSLSGTE